MDRLDGLHVQELAQGGSLLNLSRSHPAGVGALTIGGVMRLLKHVAAGLARLHDCGLPHGGLHPGNILISTCPEDDPVGLAGSELGDQERAVAASAALASGTAVVKLGDAGCGVALRTTVGPRSDRIGAPGAR